jgi:hypothetical protein
MDMVAWLDEMTYRLLVCAENGAQAEEHLAIIRRWVDAQGVRLQQGRPLRADHEQIVAEALAEHECTCGPRDCDACRSGRGYARLMVGS